VSNGARILHRKKQFRRASPGSLQKKTGDSRRAVDILKLIRQVAAAMRPYALQQLVVLVVVSRALQLCTGFVQALAISI